MEGAWAVGFMAVVTLVLGFMGWRERRTNHEEIEYMKANGWEESYRFPRHFWWHRKTNRAIPFGQYAKNRGEIRRLVEKASWSKKKKN